MKYLRYLLVFVPISFITQYFSTNAILHFVVPGIGLISLSILLNDSIDSLTYYFGPRVSAILFATLGNATELIVTTIALIAGHVALARAAIMGAVLGNLLVVPGLAMFFGGLKNGSQRFKTQEVQKSTTMMTLSVIGFLIPTLFGYMYLMNTHQPIVSAPGSDPNLFILSIGVAIILFIVYILGLIFSLITNQKEENKPQKVQWSLMSTLSILIGSTLLISFLSDYMINAVEDLVKTFHLNEIFLGVILLPFVGDVPEHLIGIQQGISNKMHLALTISMESAAQIVLFVAPVLSLISIFLPTHMTFFFEPLEILVLGLGVFVAIQVTKDGESNWLEGIQLLAIYLIAGIAFFLL